MVTPFLYKLMSHDYKPYVTRLPIADDIILKKTGREEWRPVSILDDGTVLPVEYHGSGHFNALSSADAVIRLEGNSQTLKKGSMVDVRQL